MKSYPFDRRAVKEYHARQKRYIEMGLDYYANAVFTESLAVLFTGSVLEIGTGRGLVTTYIAHKTELVTLDVDPEIQAFAKELAKSDGVYEKITFILRDILKDPYSQGSFDTVISANAVHHFECAEKMIREICTVSSRKVVIADFNAEGFDILKRLHREEGSDHSSGKFLLEEAINVMRSEGFLVTRHEKLQTIAFIGEKKTPQ